MSQTLTVLHLSDLHARGSREIESWRRRRVIGEDNWRRNLDGLLEDGPIDLVCFTGDLAQAGRADEYKEAAEFLHFTLQQLHLDPARLSIVPGNHDIDRSVELGAWQTVRRNLHRFEDLEISRWLAGGEAPFGYTDDLRDKLLLRQGAFQSWLPEFGLEHLAASRSVHGRLGFRQTLRLPGKPFDVHLIGLDSAWLSGDDSDSGRLRLTEDQVMRLTTDPLGRPLPGLRLALLHHPLSDLADGTACRRLLAEHVDVLLRGHLHEAEPELWADPQRSLRQIAAGCLYEGHRADHYPNACALIRVTCDDGGRPLRYELRFRSFSPRGGHWFDDGGLYRAAGTGRLTIDLAKPRLSTATASAPDRKSPPRIFVGRQSELRQLSTALVAGAGAMVGTPSMRPVVLVGLGGVGKSTLAEQFFHQHSDQFPGGLVRLLLPIDATVSSDETDLLRQMADQIGIQLSGLELREAVLLRLRHPRTLLLIENVDSERVAEVVAALVSGFPECCVLITGRLSGLGDSVGWLQIPLAPLDEAEALQLLSGGLPAGPNARETEERKELVRELGYLPLAIQLAAGHLRSGRTVAGFLHAFKSKSLELLPADPADPLRRQPVERATIRSSFQLSLELLRQQLGEDAHRLLDGFAAFAWLPSVFVGDDLGATVAGLSKQEFEQLMFETHRLSIVEKERGNQRWRMHPLMSLVARSEEQHSHAKAQLDEWFLSRLPGLPPNRAAEQGEKWQAVHAERDALTAWLAALTGQEAQQVVRTAGCYGQLVGPFLTWVGVCERGLAELGLQPKEQAPLLHTLISVLERCGQPQEAELRANELRVLTKKTGDDLSYAHASSQFANLLAARGQPGEALRILQEEALPMYAKLGAARDHALTLGQIADIYAERGDLDAASKIHKEQELPVYEKLGDIRERAVVLVKLSDIYRNRGQVDEALRILREEVLPAFGRLGDIRSRAVTQSKLADIYKGQGRMDEAQRIYIEDAMPVFEKLGDVRERAVTLGNIADIHQIRGRLDEALRIRLEEQLPVFEKIGDVRARAVTLGKIADIHKARGDLTEALRIRLEEQLPIFEKLGDVRQRALTWSKIADIYRNRGQLDEALRIHNEELPALDRGDIRAHAVTQEKIGDVYQDKNQIEDALRLFRDALPAFEKLGDVRQQAVTRAKIAGIYQNQGRQEDALRILREEVVPVFERLGEVRLRAISLIQIARILKKRQEFDAAVALLDSQVLPQLEQLRIELPLARARYVLAQTLLLRERVGDRKRAIELLGLAYKAASTAGIVWAENVRALQLRYGLLRLEVLPVEHALIENVRSITRLSLPLHPRLTVLYGRNACGKTTVLDALALGLSPLVRLLHESSGMEHDARSLLRREWPSGDAEPRIASYCRLTFSKGKLQWDETLLRDDEVTSAGVGTSALAKQLRATLKAIRGGKGEWQSLPVVAYYGVERAVEVQAQREANLLRELPRLDALDGALRATSRFQQAVDWFRTMEDRERRERDKRSEPGYRSAALDAVRGILEKILSGCSRPRISEPPERLVVDYARPDGAVEVLDLGQLSDGYRTHFALVLDLARRMVQANPAPPEPQPGFVWGVEAPALVLIDEIDLHLHPAWQQTVLTDLLSAFPGTQFVITTHSEQVLASCPVDSLIWELRRVGETIQAKPPNVPLPGAASDQVLEVGMEVPPRVADHPFVKRLNGYKDLVYAGRWNEPEARTLRAELDAIRIDDPGLLDADAEIDRQRLFSEPLDPAQTGKSP